MTRSEKLIVAIGILVAVAGVLARFLALDAIPNGWFIDESFESLAALCLKEGLTTPLFSPGGGGSFVPPTHLYGVATWVSFFGRSIASLRAYSAFFGALGVVGMYFLGCQLKGRRLGYWCLVVAAVCPWAFTNSRIAWKTGVMPCFLIWGTYCLLRGIKRTDISGYLLASLFFSLAMYQYDPARAQIPLLCCGIGLIYWRQLNWRGVAYLGAVGCILCLPLMVLTLNGAIMRRSAEISVFVHYPLAEALVQVAKNFLLHIDPVYLFIRGDSNLRHSIPNVGQVGWLDAGAFLWLFVAASRWIYSKLGGTRLSTVPQPLDETKKAVAVSVLGYATAVIPAALTIEALPHSLRSIGGWPFVALLTATAIVSSIDLLPRLRTAWIALAVMFSCFFGYQYFVGYRESSKEPFSYSTIALVHDVRTGKLTWEEFAWGRSPDVLFFLVSEKGLSCSEAKKFVNASTEVSTDSTSPTNSGPANEDYFSLTPYRIPFYLPAIKFLLVPS